MRNFANLIALLFVIAAGGCAQQIESRWTKDMPASDHIIAVNEKGDSIDPDHPGDFDRVEEPEVYARRLVHIKAKIAEFTDTHGGDVRKVLVFVHGGLVDPLEAMKSASQRATLIREAGYYPLFVIWNSKLDSTYREHVAFVRRGRHVSDDWLASPFYLLSDIGTAVFRAPLVWGRQMRNDWYRLGADYAAATAKPPNPELLLSDNPQLYTSIRTTGVLVDEYGSDRIEQERRAATRPATQPHQVRNYINGDAMHVSLDKIEGATGPSLSLAAYTIMVPVKIAVSPILDGIGTPAWDNMCRRAMILLDGYTDRQFKHATTDKEIRALIFKRGDGVLLRLIRDVFEEIANSNTPGKIKDGLEPGVRPYKITLVGHSMGSIVLNEFVRRSDQVDYENIVYMAAACSVREFQRAVLPYMEEHPRTVFYNLTLNPANELREVEMYEIPPRGSLLVWIDDMYANPLTPLDRTLGRWDNITEAAYVIPPRLRGRVRWKGFGMQQSSDKGIVDKEGYVTIPQQHGDFSVMRFWDAKVWQPSDPPSAKQNVTTLIEQINAPARENRARQRAE